nr:MAG TPA: hypothetical protein [Caudoviricetes sp.]
MLGLFLFGIIKLSIIGKRATRLSHSSFLCL